MNQAGIIEQKYAQRRRNADVQKIVLQTVATAGLLSAALIAPNALVAFKKLGLLSTPRQRDSIRVSRDTLVNKGLLVWEEERLRLTPAGEKRLRTLALNDYKIPIPKKWDERWRMLIFDIPEKRRKLRDKIRNTLTAVGFIHLQHSVWLYPYPCESLVSLLKADFGIGRDMLYVIVDTLEYDEPYRKHFGLS